MVAKRYASHSAIVADHRTAAIPCPRAVLVLCQCVCGDGSGSGSNSDSQFVVATSTYLRDHRDVTVLVYNRDSLGVTAARSLIHHGGRVLVGDVIVTGMERRDGGEGGATERGWWRVSLPLCEDSGLSCQVQLRWSR
ncbi:hypothetical protein ALC56_14001 [Trachymyrmex septentrionalis]|uniref:Uncharacterized protein n=1 Tax=Trachymyrmex septentrionalis TaxID=34720 RepID=A0A195EVD9_9HYME|nr:hypothetical protein ALC56_14001 [Trachymyrmex septentrionalis]